MRYQIIVITSLLAASLHARALSSGMEQGLPLTNGRPAVASVNGDAIYLDELLREVRPAADRARLRQGRATEEELTLLNRLITIRLIVQEAATMGLAEIPEIQKQIEVTSREILREVLVDQLVKDVKPDAAAVERIFKEMSREWKTTSVLFQEEPAARRAHMEISNGAVFADVVEKAVAAKTAKLDDDTTYHPKQDYLPQIAEAVAPLKVGQIGPLVRLQAGFVIVRVDGIRHPENAEARAAATEQVLNQEKLKVLEAYEQTLRRDYVAVSKAVLDSLDYEATSPTFERLLEDKRIVAQIKGAASVTVGDLTDYLRLQYFHGSNQSAQRRRMNEEKEEALNATLGRRVLNAEALRLGIDKTNAYRDRVRGYTESLVFESFVQKVVAPENKMTEDEVRQHYDGNLEDYSYPGMLRLRSLAFARRDAAEDAVRKLRAGTDYNWLIANADGQVPKETPGLLTLGGQLVTIDSMPDGLQKALAGVKTGESRLYASPEGHFYVLTVQQAVGSTVRPYGDVREEIAKTLYAEKISKGVEDYAGKLRAQLKVETYLVRTR